MSLPKGPVMYITMRAANPPVRPNWVHVIKHDGYRLQVHRAGSPVRLFTRLVGPALSRFGAVHTLANPDKIPLELIEMQVGRQLSR
jgi:ATP-dependent DNA ligase